MVVVEPEPEPVAAAAESGDDGPTEVSEPESEAPAASKRRGWWQRLVE